MRHTEAGRGRRRDRPTARSMLTSCCMLVAVAEGVLRQLAAVPTDVRPGGSFLALKKPVRSSRRRMARGTARSFKPCRSMMSRPGRSCGADSVDAGGVTVESRQTHSGLTGPRRPWARHDRPPDVQAAPLDVIMLMHQRSCTAGAMVVTNGVAGRTERPRRTVGGLRQRPGQCDGCRGEGRAPPITDPSPRRRRLSWMWARRTAGSDALRQTAVLDEAPR